MALVQGEEGQGTSMPIKDTAKAMIQTKDTEEDESSQPRRMKIDTQLVQQGGDVRMEILRGMMSHRVDVLKNI